MEKLINKLEAHSNYKLVSHNYFILDDYSSDMCNKISEDGKINIRNLEENIKNYKTKK